MSCFHWMHHDLRYQSHPSSLVDCPARVILRWDELYMAIRATTINENGLERILCRHVWSRGLRPYWCFSSPRMSLTRDALWHNGMSPPRERRAREGDSHISSATCWRRIE